MSEAKLWGDIQSGMVARWHAQRHEDKHSTGIPDVSFGIGRRSEGWVELKYLPEMPNLSSNKPWDFKYDHFTSDQRNWLELRLRHGTGRLFLLCRFGDDLTALWNWERMRLRLGVQPLRDIINAANAQWWHGVDFGELENVLTNSRVIPPRFKI